MLNQPNGIERRTEQKQEVFLFFNEKGERDSYLFIGYHFAKIFHKKGTRFFRNFFRKFSSFSSLKTTFCFSNEQKNQSTPNRKKREILQSTRNG